MTTYLRPEGEQAVREELDRILSSRHFYASRRFRDFLTFLVEETLAGRGPEIKAYSIAISVFKRPPDFDPQSDAVVRVEAAKLRKRLADYYSTCPVPPEVEISIPKGHYIAEFIWRDREKAARQTAEDAQPAPASSAEKLAQPGSASPKPAILVAPFINLGKEDTDEHLISGLVEEIIIALTRFQDLSVINANSLPPEENEDISLFAQKLGARFLLQGSMQALGNSLRIRVNLIDVQKHIVIWAERYDSSYETSTLLPVLDEITNKVAAAVAGSFGFISKSLLGEFGLEESLRPRPTTKDFTAYEAVLAYNNWIGTLNEQSTKAATQFLEKAIVLDPNYALAKSMLSDVYCATSQWSCSNEEGEALQERAAFLALEAEKLNPHCQYSQWARAFTLFLHKEGEEFLKKARLVLSLNPANTNITSAVGLKLVVYGEWDEGMKVIEHSRRLNPFLPQWYFLAPFLIHYMQDNLEEALNYARKLHLSGYIVGPLIRAAILGRMGQKELAVDEIGNVLSICPGFAATGRRTLERLLFHKEQVKAVMQGLEQAGLKIL